MVATLLVTDEVRRINLSARKIKVWAVHYHGTVCYTVQGGSNDNVCEKI